MRASLFNSPQLAALVCCCLLYGMASAAQHQWECLPTADGQGWQCGQAGTLEREPVLLPPTPAAPARSPAAAPEKEAPPTTEQPEPTNVIPATRRPPPQPEKTASTAENRPDQPGATTINPAPTPEPEITGSPPTQDTLVSSEVEESLSDETAVTTETPEEPESAVPANQYEVLMDQGMAWDECKAAAVPGLPAPSNDLIEIEADSATAFPEQDSAQFQGNVIIRHPNQTLYADDLHYDNRRQLIKADQQLLIQLRDLRLLGKQAWFDLNEYKGEMADVSYRIPSRKARGEAGKMTLLDEDHSRFEGISYTTCPPGNRGFMLSADSMEIDQEKQIGIFKAARLRFLGVPVFYAPSLTVSLDDSRKSGLLVPSLGYSSKNGADITTPYYFNLAPNYDATIMPRLLSKRGLLLGGEFRFLTPRNDGLFFGEILPDDRESDKHGTRGAIHARTHSNLNFLTEGLSADVDINWVSDDDYLDDLGRSLAVTSTRHLLSRAALNWRLPEWDAIAEVRDYKTLDEGIAAEDHPYSLLPRLAVNWTRFQGLGGLDYSVGVEMTSFHRDDSVTGSRFDLRPRASLPLRNNWGFLEPALSGRYTIYELDDQVPGLDDKPDRATWSASLDGGLFFDRSVNWFGRDMTHTIEPRAFYLYTPHVNQDDLPLFDTGLLDYSFDNLFRDNRFNGPDRVGDANQLTLALTSRVLSGNNGRELLNASIGQIYYFEDRRVTLYDDDPTDTRSSSVIAELSTGIFDHWLMRAGVQVDPHAGTGIQQGLAQANYHGESGERFHASWRLREGVLEQTDLAAYWPVSEKISLIGRWYYSVEERQNLETVAGIEYGDCCWRVRAVWRRYLDSDGTEYNNTALLQLELNGLGKLGNDIDNFLDRTIYGY